MGDNQWKLLFQHLDQDDSIEEIILSGGDPLMLTDSQLSKIVDGLEAIPHLRILRLHTRMPVAIPSRITRTIVERLRTSRFSTYLVLHINHANEIDSELEAAIQSIKLAGLVILNQSVLLRGVNDNRNALVDLSKKLIRVGCQPYYLHQLDRVRGATHFEVAEHRGKQLIAAMREQLPGYAVPRFVKEIAGQPSKSIIA